MAQLCEIQTKLNTEYSFSTATATTAPAFPPGPVPTYLQLPAAIGRPVRRLQPIWVGPGPAASRLFLLPPPFAGVPQRSHTRRKV